MGVNLCFWIIYFLHVMELACINVICHNIILVWQLIIYNNDEDDLGLNIYLDLDVLSCFISSLYHDLA